MCPKHRRGHWGWSPGCEGGDGPLGNEDKGQTRQGQVAPLTDSGLDSKSHGKLVKVIKLRTC